LIHKTQNGKCCGLRTSTAGWFTECTNLNTVSFEHRATTIPGCIQDVGHEPHDVSCFAVIQSLSLNDNISDVSWPKLIIMVAWLMPKWCGLWMIITKRPLLLGIGEAFARHIISGGQV